MSDLLHSIAADLHAVVGDALSETEFADVVDRTLAERMTSARF